MHAEATGLWMPCSFLSTGCRGGIGNLNLEATSGLSRRCPYPCQLYGPALRIQYFEASGLVGSSGHIWIHQYLTSEIAERNLNSFPLGDRNFLILNSQIWVREAAETPKIDKVNVKSRLYRLSWSEKREIMFLLDGRDFLILPKLPNLGPRNCIVVGPRDRQDYCQANP